MMEATLLTVAFLFYLDYPFVTLFWHRHSKCLIALFVGSPSALHLGLKQPPRQEPEITNFPGCALCAVSGVTCDTDMTFVPITQSPLTRGAGNKTLRRTKWEQICHKTKYKNAIQCVPVVIESPSKGETFFWKVVISKSHNYFDDLFAM